MGFHFERFHTQATPQLLNAADHSRPQTSSTISGQHGDSRHPTYALGTDRQSGGGYRQISIKHQNVACRRVQAIDVYLVRKALLPLQDLLPYSVSLLKLLRRADLLD